MSELAASVFPPQDFVDRLNSRQQLDPPLTALDPLAMLLWHEITAARSPLLAVTGAA